MRKLHVEGAGLSPAERQRIAGAVAAAMLGDPMLLSWYDDELGQESPNGVSECGAAPPSQGVWNYALNRGAVLAVCFESERHLFCFRDHAADE